MEIRWVGQGRATCPPLGASKARQSRRNKKARHSPGNAHSHERRLLVHQIREGRSAGEEVLLLLCDRLTTRPKHSDFRERISLRGEIKERRSSVEANTSRQALQAFRGSASMTEGARSFRRRGAIALRFPQKWGPIKSGQRNDANAKALHLEVSTHAIRSNRGNSSAEQSG